MTVARRGAILRIIGIIVFLALLVAAGVRFCYQKKQLNTESAKDYYFKCQKGAVYHYVAIKNGEPYWKRSAKVEKCEISGDKFIYEMLIEIDHKPFNENKNEKTFKNRFTVEVSDKEIKIIYSDFSGTDFIALEKPFIEGSEWLTNTEHIVNGKSKIFQRKNIITRIYDTKVLGETRKCIEVTFDNNFAHTYCKGIGPRGFSVLPNGRDEFLVKIE